MTVNAARVGLTKSEVVGKLLNWGGWWEYVTLWHPHHYP